MMLQGEHSAILSTFIKLPFVIKNFAVSIFEWQFYISFFCHKYHAYRNVAVLGIPCFKVLKILSLIKCMSPGL